MIGWSHQLNGHEFEQAPGGGDGHGVAKSQTQLNCTELFEKPLGKYGKS